MNLFLVVVHNCNLRIKLVKFAQLNNVSEIKPFTEAATGGVL